MPKKLRGSVFCTLICIIQYAIKVAFASQTNFFGANLLLLRLFVEKRQKLKNKQLMVMDGWVLLFIEYSPPPRDHMGKEKEINSNQPEDIDAHPTWWSTEWYWADSLCPVHYYSVDESTIWPWPPLLHLSFAGSRKNIKQQSISEYQCNVCLKWTREHQNDLCGPNQIFVNSSSI